MRCTLPKYHGRVAVVLGGLNDSTDTVQSTASAKRYCADSSSNIDFICYTTGFNDIYLVFI